jgi:hypothetical protein
MYMESKFFLFIEQSVAIIYIIINIVISKWVRMRGIKNQNERRISNISNFHALLKEEEWNQSDDAWKHLWYTKNDLNERYQVSVLCQVFSFCKEDCQHRQVYDKYYRILDIFQVQ